STPRCRRGSPTGRLEVEGEADLSAEPAESRPLGASLDLVQPLDDRGRDALGRNADRLVEEVPRQVHRHLSQPHRHAYHMGIRLWQVKNMGSPAARAANGRVPPCYGPPAGHPTTPPAPGGKTPRRPAGGA